MQWETPIVPCTIARKLRPPEHLDEDVCYINREYRLTRISLAIGWILLLCHSWKVIPAAYNLYQSLHLGQGTTAEDLGSPTSPEWLVWVERIGKLLLTLNASLNLIIYAAL